MPLCVACQNLNLHDFSKPQNGAWVSARELSTVRCGADEAECDFCALLYRDVADLIPQIAIPEYDVCLLLKFYHFPLPPPRGKGFWGINKLRVEIEPGPKRQGMNAAEWVPQRYNEYSVVADPDSAAATDRIAPIIGRYLGQDPKSPLILEAVNGWLDKCKTQHPACTKTVSSTSYLDHEDADLPTRCIEVTADTNTLFLRETLGTTGRYITLSHRWHKRITEASETTSTNYVDRLSGRCLESIPQTFFDAIGIARAMNVRYIWIDSLCIIQKSSDWTTESLKMADYYQKAWFNIAITDGSPRKGCLSAWPDKPFSELVRLPYRNSDGVQKSCFYVYKPTWHVNTRFQVSVTNTLLRVPELRTAGDDRVSRYREDLSKFKRGYHFDGSPTRWYSVVRPYSRLDVTKLSDRIIALAGVAREMRESFRAVDQREKKERPLEYVSGLWLRDIHRGLLWEVWSPFLTASEQQREIVGIPSWSWASVLMAVCWFFDSKERIRVQEAFTVTKVHAQQPENEVRDLTTSNQLGSNPSLHSFDVDNFTSSLFIRAKFVRVRIREPLDAAGIRTAASASGECQRIDQRRKDWKERLRWWAVCPTSFPETLSGWASMERLVDFEKEPVYALHVATKRAQYGLSYGYFSLTHPVYSVLFLVSCGDGEGKYKRTGVGRVFGKEMVREIDRALEREVELV